MPTRVSRSLATLVAAGTLAVAAAPAGTLSFSQPESKPGATQPTQPTPTGRGPGEPGGRGGPGRAGRPDGQGPSVQAAMKAINRGYRQLGDQIASAAKKDDNLRIIGEMQRATLAAKGQPVPADLLAHAGDDAAKAKLAATFRSELIGALRAMLDLEQDVVDGRTDAAKSKLEALLKVRDHGHTAMGVSEEEDGPGEPPAKPAPPKP